MQPRPPKNLKKFQGAVRYSLIHEFDSSMDSQSKSSASFHEKPVNRYDLIM